MSYSGKGPTDFQAKGNWNSRCSMCGFKRKASTLVKNWQGMWRCPIHNEPRHPQDYVRGIPDNTNPPWVQPGGQTFVEVYDILTTDDDVFILTDSGEVIFV